MRDQSNLISYFSTAKCQRFQRYFPIMVIVLILTRENVTSSAVKGKELPEKYLYI